MTQRYFKAEARDVVVTRTSASRDYTHAAIFSYANGRIDASFSASLAGAIALSNDYRARLSAWAEVVPVTIIDRKEYVALGTTRRRRA
jgi:hypothetical protein